MVEPDFLRFDTLSLHAGQHADPVTGARAQPIYYTTSYEFPDTDEAAALFNLELPGHIYSRISNPTVAVFEERVAALEGGVRAAVILDGRVANACLLELYTEHGAGSIIRLDGGVSGIAGNG